MSTKKPAPQKQNNEFCISFDTQSDKANGYIKTVKVTIEEDVMSAGDSVFVNLCDHPLYNHLERYVLANRRSE